MEFTPRKWEMRIYLKYLLKKERSIALIFIKPQWLFEFVDLITDRFILNKRYRFDVRDNDFVTFPIYNFIKQNRANFNL